jgi:hypothetical protein
MSIYGNNHSFGFGGPLDDLHLGHDHSLPHGRYIRPVDHSHPGGLIIEHMSIYGNNHSLGFDHSHSAYGTDPKSMEYRVGYGHPLEIGFLAPPPGGLIIAHMSMYGNNHSLEEDDDEEIDAVYCTVYTTRSIDEIVGLFEEGWLRGSTSTVEESLAELLIQDVAKCLALPQSQITEVERPPMYVLF